jgi:hypothetical protein
MTLPGTTLEFPDNKLLRGLGGRHARHFARLGEALTLPEGVDGVEGVGVARFTEKDAVRHPLVARIVAAYNRDGKS